MYLSVMDIYSKRLKMACHKTGMPYHHIKYFVIQKLTSTCAQPYSMGMFFARLPARRIGFNFKEDWTK